MANYLATWIDLEMLPARIRLAAFTEVTERAEAQGMDVIAEHARRGVRHEQRTMELERALRRRAELAERTIARATPASRRLKRSLRGLHNYLEALVDIFGEESVRGRAAVALSNTLFPAGIETFGHLSPMEQHARLYRLLERVSSPDLADEMGALPELVQIIEHVHHLHHRLGEALHTSDHRPPTNDEVRAAQLFGHELMCETVVLILATFIRERPLDRELREYLLEPIERRRQARRGVPRDGELPAAEAAGPTVVTGGAHRGAVVDTEPAEGEEAAGPGRLPGMEPGGVPGVDLGGERYEEAGPPMGPEEPDSTVLIGGTEPHPRVS